MQVVIVESPAKAKTINKYLGDGYTVLASYGHVRDLPPKDGSVRPDQDFAMDWEIGANSAKHMKLIADAARESTGVILATDPDREGEAISWHVLEELKARKAIKGIPVQRVTFNAITKASVLEAMQHPRELDGELIDAYMARRALDYLFGFTLSPVLWRKLPGSKSAGRVQSVALRIICDRELEIEKFKPQEYWSIESDVATAKGEVFSARLTHANGAKLDKFDLANQELAGKAADAIKAGAFSVLDVEKKNKLRRPYAPFTTSTMQMDASRRLYFTARQTMQTAQGLYEGVNIGGETVGLITYMRTDGVQIDPEAIKAVRTLIEKDYGPKCLPATPRVYVAKAKNAQEAHEAIRPTDPGRRPQDVQQYLTPDQFKLYDLIWRRTIASQMESAVMDQVAVDLGTADRQTILRANGSVIVFRGFLEAYEEGPSLAKAAEDEEEGMGRILPAVEVGQPITINVVSPNQHFTQPPPRFSEASLVKALEEKGIGRPSTYASIIQVLQDRKYCRMDARRFIPEDRGRVVIAFLESFFAHYVEYDFTANLEEQLDDISGGRLKWKDVLAGFWRDFIAAVDGTKDLSRTKVIDALDAMLEPHLFPERKDGTNPRKCPACSEGRIGLKFGRFGSFIGCSKYPTCRYTRPLGAPEPGEGSIALDGPKDLGTDPVSGLKITLRVGPYGPYVQVGGEIAPPPPPPPPPTEPVAADPATPVATDSAVAAAPPKKAKRKKKVDVPKPKRASIPKGVDPATVDLALALKILSLPREVGGHPETGEIILAGIGRFGPYLKMGDRYQSLKGDDDVLAIGLNRAVVVLAEGKDRQSRKGPAGKSLGKHPEDGKSITVKAGRFGPYVQHGMVRATLPRDQDPDTVTIDAAVALLTTKAGKSAAPKGRGRSAAKAAEA